MIFRTLLATIYENFYPGPPLEKILGAPLASNLLSNSPRNLINHHNSSTCPPLPLPSTSRCDDGYVRIYLRGQEVKEAFDKFDREFCGRQVPEPVRSNGARLSMVFSSGVTQGSGFKADFKFETGG